MGSFRDWLGAALPEHKHKTFLYERGRRAPAINELSVGETFLKFKTEFLPKCPLPDRLGRLVRVEVTNFRKLLNLKPKSGEEKRAWKVIKELETGIFDISQYHLPGDRIKTLFWIPDILFNPDAIYKCVHPTVDAEEVFVAVYDKPGSKVKLVFTRNFGSPTKPRIDIVSSFLTDAKGAIECFGERIYPK
jgi:hypothetical protein